MKVLLYIPKNIEKTGVSMKLIAALTRCLDQKAEATAADHLPKDWKSYDVIHVFGCWDYGAARVIRKAEKECIPTVYSPLGGLQPWIVRKYKADQRLTTYLYQRRMTGNASAVHLCSPLEQENFERLKWNARTQMIMNPVITSQLSEEDMTAQMMQLYQKVIDTNAYARIGETQERAILSLLQAGIDPGRLADQSFQTRTNEALGILSAEDWRNIFIYSSDEQILSLIKIGLKRIQFIEPDIVVEDIDRFPPPHHYATGHLESHQLIATRPPAKVRHVTDSMEEGSEKEICVMILNIRRELRQHAMPLLHLADLYGKIKFADYDEDRLAETLSRLDIYHFAARLISILATDLGLTEGFQPIETINDRETDRIRRSIIKLRVKS